MFVRAHFAGAQGRFARHRLHRPQQRRQVVAHQHADQPHRVGQGLRYAGQDALGQPFLHRQGVVPRRPARLRLCPHFQDPARRVLQADYRLRPAVRKAPFPVRARRHPARAAENRPAFHRDAGSERGAVRHHLHQGRQALADPGPAQRRAFPRRPGRAVGGVSAHVRLLVGQGGRARGNPLVHRPVSGG